MLEKEKNLKDNLSPAISSGGVEGWGLKMSFSYNKINKLISALYIVTDIMDRQEPLRNKLRGLGTDIISDIHSSDKGHDLYTKINKQISEILSLLEVASSVSIVSPMNSGILTKEFIELRKSIVDASSMNGQNWLEEFIKEGEESSYLTSALPAKRENPIGQASTRIGVQKGSTLLKALKKVEVSDRVPSFSRDNKRREEIISIIKDKMNKLPNFSGITITDIKSIGQGLSAGQAGILASCGEKTLQRELISMVKDGVLVKIGAKRWSKYLLK